MVRDGLWGGLKLERQVDKKAQRGLEGIFDVEKRILVLVNSSAHRHTQQSCSSLSRGAKHITSGFRYMIFFRFFLKKQELHTAKSKSPLDHVTIVIIVKPRSSIASATHSPVCSLN
jgi:hypothetical protein